jgi:hypothetical protein
VSAPASAQDLGPHFKKVKDGIITYVAKPDESNCTIVLSSEGVVLIDSGHNPTDSQTILKAVKQLTLLPIGHTLEQIQKELKMPEIETWAGKERFNTNVDAAYRAVKG